MLWVGSSPRSPYYGETLAYYSRAVYPPRLLWMAAHLWNSVFLWLYLGHINMESKGLAMPTKIFPLGGTDAGVCTSKSETGPYM
jgi:hypothetical protein